MEKDCSTCLYKEGLCYPSTTIFNKDKTCRSYTPDYEGYIAELEKENNELKNVKIPQLERKIASIRGTHSVCRKSAEFGYNKANEWHYVKDGDLPKETGLLMSKTLLLVTKIKGSDCLSLALGEYNFSTQEFSYQHIVGLTDVIAWKEIILPKEIKENE